MKGFVIRYKTRLKAVVLTILIASTATAAAQDYRYEAGIGLGISGYLGDVNQSNVLKSPGFIGVGLLIVVGQFIIVTFGGEMFSVTPLTATDWGLIILATSTVLWVGEILRGITRLFKKCKE